MTSEAEFVIDLGNDFSKKPWGRTLAKHGIYSGEVFREKLLKPALNEHDIVIVNLSNAKGLGTSFLHEAISKVAFDLTWNISTFKKHIKIKSLIRPELTILIFEFAQQEYERKLRLQKTTVK